MSNFTAVRHAITEELFQATAQEVADHLDMSASTARRHLNTLEREGVVVVHSRSGYSNSGRSTSVNYYVAVFTGPVTAADPAPLEPAPAAPVPNISRALLGSLAKLNDAVTDEHRIVWEDDENVHDGIVRHGFWQLVDGEPRGYIGHDENVFEAHVRITTRTGLEIWKPVPEMLDLIGKRQAILRAR